jgi:hypothetical protein
MWTHHTTACLEHWHLDEAGTDVWQASHDGYRGRGVPLRLRRRLALHHASQRLVVEDEVQVLEEGAGFAWPMVWHWHFDASLRLCHPSPLEPGVWRVEDEHGRLVLAMVAPPQAGLKLLQGSLDPVGGWVSGRLGHKQACYTLQVRCVLKPGEVLRHTLAWGEGAVFKTGRPSPGLA